MFRGRRHTTAVWQVGGQGCKIRVAGQLEFPLSLTLPAEEGGNGKGRERGTHTFLPTKTATL